jgi:hypothetical protein
MSNADKTTKLYLVLGVMNTGSGSLTYPEDFDFDRVYTKPKDAQKRVNELNDREGVPVDARPPSIDPDDDSVSEHENEDDEDDSDEEYEGLVYEVVSLDHVGDLVKKKTSKKKGS